MASLKTLGLTAVTMMFWNSLLARAAAMATAIPARRALRVGASKLMREE